MSEVNQPQDTNALTLQGYTPETLPASAAVEAMLEDKLTASGFATSQTMSDNIVIAGWGDSLTEGAGGGGTTYLTRLNALTGFTTYNGGVGGETAAQIATRMLAASSRYGQLVIIWAGRNGVLTNTVSAKAAIASMVAALTTDHYIVLSVLNASTEISGSADYITVTGFNSDLATLYGSHYKDVRAYLVALAPNVDDIIDTAYRSDTIHLNAAGYSAVGDYIFANRSVLQGTQIEVTGPAQVLNSFLAPPAIGAITPNTGAFTTLSSTGAITAPGVTVTPAIGTNSPFISLKQLAGTNRTISLISDGTAFSVNAQWLPATDASIDLGRTALRWKDLILSGGASGGGACSFTSLSATGGFISAIRNGQTRSIHASTDGLAWQVNSTFQPSVDASYDLGITGQRWRNAKFSADVSAATVNGNTITTGTGTLMLGAGKTLTVSNTITLTATDGSTLAIGTGGTLGTAAYTQAPLTATATLDFGSIAAGASEDLTITVTGAAVGDAVVVGPPTTIPANTSVYGFVSAANTVTIRVGNLQLVGAIDPPSATWRATVLKS